MENKTDLVLNQMASNFGAKIGQLEGEKAILQVELQEAYQTIQNLEQKLEATRKEDE